MEEWPKVRTRPNSRDFHEYTYDIHIQVNMYTMWLLYSTRVVLPGAKVGAETTGTEGETFRSQQSPSSVVVGRYPARKVND